MLIQDNKSDNLISMTKTMTATEVSRNFSDVLDLVEGGETVFITRGKKVIAKFEGMRRETSGKTIADFLSALPEPDEDAQIKAIWDSVMSERDLDEQNRERY